MRRISNPPNPYVSVHQDWLEEPPAASPEVYVESARSILSRNDSPDLHFRWTCNPYRGCQHACAYCYARTTHEYLGWGAGTDFETRLIIKRNAPELLRKALASPGWRGECVAFSGATDCYQPLEAVWHLTRRCLEVCRDFRNPVGVVTKSYLIRRDVDLLADMAAARGAQVCISITCADAELSKRLEPQAPSPDRRFEAMRILARAGVPVGVVLAPIVPGLNDAEMPAVLRRAADCGATMAQFAPLRLPGSVEQVFLDRLDREIPARAQRVRNRLREVRGGKLNDCRFQSRMTGQGPYWAAIERLFRVTCERAGLNRRDTDDAASERAEAHNAGHPESRSTGPECSGILCEPVSQGRARNSALRVVQPAEQRELPFMRE